MKGKISLAKLLIKKCLSQQIPLLDLSYLNINRLVDLPELFECTHLTELNLEGNDLISINGIQRLKELRNLNLRNNKLDSYSPIEGMLQIEYLELGFNRIMNLQFLEHLPALKILSLESNQITHIHYLQNLRTLKFLNLSHNQILDIRDLSELFSLETLNLSYNRISNIEPIEKLTNIKNLNLSYNSITSIPIFLFKRFQAYGTDQFTQKDLKLGGNPIIFPPIEIINQGQQSVIKWFKANRAQLKEIKIILIGDPKAGKTSLLKRLKLDTFNENEVPTDGINIESVFFESCAPFKNQTNIHSLTGHFWDFGGQEIMNATHQFFLTNRSVYILVLDARKDTNVATQIRQWVSKIKATGGNSPIIVVSNQIDLNTGFGFENEYELQQKFPQIKCFIKVSSKDKTGIDTLKEKLSEWIPNAELFHTEIDERWIDIKEQLQRETKNEHFLNEKRFRSICRAHDLFEKQHQANAINFLNDLGLVLHFQNVNLSEYFVLDPYWITYGVYQILTSKFAGEVKGKVPMEKLEYIVNEEQDKEKVYRPSDYKKITYSNNERRFLVDILNEFKLCFYLDNRNYFILPDLLDTQEPTNLTFPIRESKESIRFVYKYEYLPKSTMPYIMVETHKLAKANWRTGSIIENADCQALIGAYENRLSITVVGKHKQKREFMSVIRFLIDSINSKLAYQPSMLIPLPDNMGYADYEELLEIEIDGDTHYKIYKPQKRRFEISQLLEGITSQSELRELTDIAKLMLKKTNEVKAGNDIILDELNSIRGELKVHYNYLMEQLGKGDQAGILLQSIASLNLQQQKALTVDIESFLSNAFESSNTKIDTKLTQIYTDLKKSSNLEAKIKLGLPLAALTGIDMGVELKFDVKKWIVQMSEKHGTDLRKFVF